MRKSAFILLVFIPAICMAKGTPDTLRTKLKADCNISFNSNGIASIPSFSLGKPAVIASIGLARGRFSYDPTLAYGLDFRPWFIDSWLHYKIVDRPSFKLRTGLNLSMYFSKLKLNDEDILQGQRYWAIEIAGLWYPTTRSLLSLMYWNDRGQDPGTIVGHYISITGERSQLNIGSHLSFTVNIQLFYIDYTGLNDGLFVSPKITSSFRDFPVSVFFQSTQAIQSNIEPFPGFKWNVGFSFPL